MKTVELQQRIFLSRNQFFSSFCSKTFFNILLWNAFFYLSFVHTISHVVFLFIATHQNEDLIVGKISRHTSFPFLRDFVSDAKICFSVCCVNVSWDRLRVCFLLFWAMITREKSSITAQRCTKFPLDRATVLGEKMVLWRVMICKKVCE